MATASKTCAVEHVSRSRTGGPPSSRSVGADRLTIALALLGLYLIWGSTYLAMRVAVETVPPFLMGAVRFLVAGTILFTVLRFRGAALPRPRQVRGAAIVGALLLMGGNGMVGFAEKTVASSLAALLIAMVPIWAAVFSTLWGRRPTRLEAAGLLIGFAGLILLNAGSDLHANLGGAAILLFASCSWAFGSVWSRYLSLPSGMMASAVEMLSGGILMLLVSVGRGERLSAMPSAHSLWAMLYLIIFGSLVAFSCYVYLLRRVRPTLATSYAYVNPVVAVALGVGTAGETVTGAGLVALVIILTGVGLVMAGQSRTNAASE